MKRLLPWLLLLALMPGCTNDPDLAEYAAPRIEDVSITPGADYSEITVSCRVSSATGIKAYGILVGEERIPAGNLQEKVFSVMVSGLEYSTSYTVKAWLESGRSTVYSGETVWTTEDEIPPAPVILQSEARPGADAGKVSFGCRIPLWENVVGKNLLRCGICYSPDSPVPTLDDAVIWAEAPSAKGGFSLALEGLVPSAEYHFRPFAQIGARTSYGEVLDLRIPSGKEVVITGTCTDLSARSVTLSGTLNWVASIGELRLYGFEIGEKVLPGGTVDESGVFTLTLSDLTPETTYSYRAVALVGEVRYYGESRSFRTLSLPPEPDVDYVDLGLSVLWAKCDLGASGPGKEGDLYAWGETSPKSAYTWETYKWCLGGPESLFKYTLELDCSQPDGKQTLEREDDAAAVNLGGQWRMPTGDEWGELILNTRIEKKPVDGVIVFEFFSTRENYEDRSILIPGMDYWTAELCGGASWAADMLIIIDNGDDITSCIADVGLKDETTLNLGDGIMIDAENLSRCLGKPIRPVRER